MKVILTGATGMAGEGVLFECLQNEEVSEVLIVNRRHYDISHPKLKELLVPDFTKLDGLEEQLKGYDACFYCAGISSVGMDEKEYTHITYDTTMAFAEKLVQLNLNMVFNYITGGSTDSTEKGSVMWARVKGKTENALMRLPFRGQYNFRPGFMKPFKGQKNVKTLYKPVIWLYPIIDPKRSLTLSGVGQAMINAVKIGYEKQVLEIEDIKKLADLER